LVLLVHGFPDTARTWDRIGPEIAGAGFRVVAPFLRGYAPSGLPARDVDSRTLGEDVIAWISALGEERASLVGHDWGAEAVYAAAGLAKERIVRMVTVAIPHRARLAITPRLAWGLRHFGTLTLPGAERRFARRDFQMVDELCRRWSPTWRFTAADLEPVKNAFAAPGSLHAALGYYRAVSMRTPPFLRAPVEVDALAIAGSDDPSVAPESFESVRPHFTRGYRVQAIPGGHFCHRESPETFSSQVIPFLRGAL
jgi:pimeloyl-ACP methyl ester carboxylesterase